MGFYAQGFLFIAFFGACLAYGLAANEPFIVGLCLSPILIVLGVMFHAARD